MFNIPKIRLSFIKDWIVVDAFAISSSGTKLTWTLLCITGNNAISKQTWSFGVHGSRNEGYSPQPLVRAPGFPGQGNWVGPSIRGHHRYVPGFGPQEIYCFSLGFRQNWKKKHKQVNFSFKMMMDNLVLFTLCFLPLTLLQSVASISKSYNQLFSKQELKQVVLSLHHQSYYIFVGLVMQLFHSQFCTKSTK